MGPAIISEFRKLFTTRLWWGMAIGIFVIGAGFAAIFALVLTLDSNAEAGISVSAEQTANTVYTGGLSFSYLLTMVVGILSIGQEYRHQTITSTLLATPRRMVAMSAKVISLLGIGAIYGLIALIGSVSVGATLLSIRGAEPFPTAGVWRSIALSLLVLGLWALIGLGAGILIKNQVAAILVMVGFGFILEPVGGIFLNLWSFGADYIAPYLPGAASGAVTAGVNGDPSVETTSLTWWVAALVLTAYAAVLTGLGMWRTQVRDVS